ncbi:DUF1826 domain-containing protein [Nisaea acidiphila]|uniref:DUF1826 domain-containing protein n=1 Tax=Nisaea acidiphila TaxID=1862145 RepID=A0A9J7AU46_9PROT|nr:DUF1826 domain-containing protein [Nisaea acidiphila]UUX48909.1 DUF1826 domain-containing protein [Nisaea acidiphila]
MTLAEQVVSQSPASSVRVTDAPDGLSEILRPDCAAVIWRRKSAPGFQSWIDALDPGQLPRARVILRPSDVRDAAAQICESCGTPDCPERDMLIDDAAALAGIFASVMEASYLKLRFDRITNDACTKFHTDAVTARLICTYRGPGTQYGLVRGMAEPSRISSVTTGSAMLLRGTLWPERPQSGLSHRSPPISGTKTTRLVLVLDPAADPESANDPIILQ